MRSVPCLVVAVSLIACAQAPDESSTSAEVISVNRIALNRIALNRIALNRIALNRIALNRIALNRLSVNLLNAKDLLATDDGREVFALTVSCALPAEITLVATVNGTDFDFPGEIGLAPQWLVGRLGDVGQRWVSACMFARVSAHEVVIPISMRGPSRALATDADERATWTLEEGAFFGDAFGPTNEPLQAFACRGRDKAAGNAGELADRDCAAPDPANPGFTLCGMAFAGDCGNFASDRACESFSDRGTFYEECHTSPIRRRHHEAYRDHGHRDEDEARVFTQVITTFATP
ncbi:MAG TPA: hypothetical protein VHW23_41295 [Kofleriaceae bacterium]|jgi:hypothetical protein|nr:hypothetical protein [Kofleriaceae bacterium]